MSLYEQFIKLASPLMVTWCLRNSYVCSKGKCHITQMCTHMLMHRQTHRHTHSPSRADNESPVMRDSSPVRQALSGVEDFPLWCGAQAILLCEKAFFPLLHTVIPHAVHTVHLEPISSSRHWNYTASINNVILDILHTPSAVKRQTLSTEVKISMFSIPLQIFKCLCIALHI